MTPAYPRKYKRSSCMHISFCSTRLTNRLRLYFFKNNQMKPQVESTLCSVREMIDRCIRARYAWMRNSIRIDMNKAASDRKWPSADDLDCNSLPSDSLTQDRFHWSKPELRLTSDGGSIRAEVMNTVAATWPGSEDIDIQHVADGPTDEHAEFSNNHQLMGEDIIRIIRWSPEGWMSIVQGRGDLSLIESIDRQEKISTLTSLHRTSSTTLSISEAIGELRVKIRHGSVDNMGTTHLVNIIEKERERMRYEAVEEITLFFTQLG